MMSDPIASVAPDQALRKSAEQDPAARLKRLQTSSVEFEAMLLQQMFQSMESTLKGGGLVGSGVSGSVYSSIMTEAISRSMAQHQGIGLGDRLTSDMIQRDPALKKLAAEQAKDAAHNASPLSPFLQGIPLESVSKADRIGMLPRKGIPNNQISMPNPP